MKKMAFFVFLAATVCGLSLAQTAPETVTVNGTLGLNGGRIVLTSGDTSYFVRGLERFIGFIEGLRDGAQAAIEGYVSPPSLEGATERLLFPVKLTLDGKDYEVGPTLAELRDRRRPDAPRRDYEAAPPAGEFRGWKHRSGRDLPRPRGGRCCR